jgi:hypothetical protein
MMKTSHLLASAGVLLSLLSGLPAQAQTQSDVEAGTALAPQSDNGVTTLCGGVGADEAARIKREAHKYNLMLTFAENTGAYLADVDVAIADVRGNALVSTTCDGPILLVRFSHPGNYKVTAEVAGRAQTRKVAIAPDHGAAVALVWPRQQVEPAPGSESPSG